MIPNVNIQSRLTIKDYFGYAFTGCWAPAVVGLTSVAIWTVTDFVTKNPYGIRIKFIVAFLIFAFVMSAYVFVYVSIIIYKSRYSYDFVGNPSSIIKKETMISEDGLKRILIYPISIYKRKKSFGFFENLKPLNGSKIVEISSVVEVTQALTNSKIADQYGVPLDGSFLWYALINKGSYRTDVFWSGLPPCFKNINDKERQRKLPEPGLVLVGINESGDESNRMVACRVALNGEFAGQTIHKDKEEVLSQLAWETGYSVGLCELVNPVEFHNKEEIQNTVIEISRSKSGAEQTGSSKPAAANRDQTGTKPGPANR